jgi:hypothetical protein
MPKKVWGNSNISAFLLLNQFKLNSYSYIHQNWLENIETHFTILVLRRVFGPKRDEVMGEGRKLHNEELRDLYSLPSIIRIIKSRRMRWAGHVA